MKHADRKKLVKSLFEASNSLSHSEISKMLNHLNPAITAMYIKNYDDTSHKNRAALQGEPGQSPKDQ
jgi:hypothetical protein